MIIIERVIFPFHQVIFLQSLLKCVSFYSFIITIIAILYSSSARNDETSVALIDIYSNDPSWSLANRPTILQSVHHRSRNDMELRDLDGDWMTIERGDENSSRTINYESIEFIIL